MLACVRILAILGSAGFLACASPAARPSAAPNATLASKPADPSPSPLADSPVAPSPHASAGGDQPTLPTGARGSLDRDELIARAVADAATRTGVGADAIRVVQAEAREWPNSGLGCEKAGMGYAQVITPGYLIVLEAGGRTLEYHTDRARVELCTP